jgi:hypothetical protein
MELKCRSNSHSTNSGFATPSFGRDGEQLCASLLYAHLQIIHPRLQNLVHSLAPTSGKVHGLHIAYKLSLLPQSERLRAQCCQPGKRVRDPRGGRQLGGANPSSFPKPPQVGKVRVATQTDLACAARPIGQMANSLARRSDTQ